MMEDVFQLRQGEEYRIEGKKKDYCIGALLFLTVELLLHLLYFVFEVINIYFVYVEFAAYIIAGIILAIVESKRSAKIIRANVGKKFKSNK